MSKIVLIELDFSSLKSKATTLTQGKSQLPGHTCSCLVCEFRGSLLLLQNLVMGQCAFSWLNDGQPLTSKTEFVRRCNFKGQSHAEGINSLTKWTFGLHLKGFSSFSWKASTRRSLLWHHFQGDAHFTEGLLHSDTRCPRIIPQWVQVPKVSEQHQSHVILSLSLDLPN